MGLEGKVAIVTGASSGIGRAIAMGFAQKGAHVALAARRKRLLKELAAEINGSGGLALPLQTDVCADEQVAAMVDATLGKFGRIDILVNSAGIGIFALLDKLTIEDWDKVIRTNLRGTFLCCKSVADAMKAQGGGHIINIASIAAVEGFPKGSAYCASKFGVLGLTKCLSIELRPHNIKVSAICPSLVDTPFYDRVKKKLPRRLMLRPEQVADLALYLVSQQDGALIEELVIKPKA